MIYTHLTSERTVITTTTIDLEAVFGPPTHDKGEDTAMNALIQMMYDPATLPPLTPGHSQSTASILYWYVRALILGKSKVKTSVYF